MKRPSPTASKMRGLGILLAFSLLVHSDTLPSVHHGRMDTLPRLTLWAWERPVDLTGIDPRTAAVAYLDRTVLVGDGITSPALRVLLRRQPLSVAQGTKKIAVVRLETQPGLYLNAAMREAVTAQMLAAVRADSAALQIDFDARRSEREWYRQLLGDVRKRMPVEMPLSVTALASWCMGDDWMAGLPVDEAVPMMFRMEPDRKRSEAERDENRIREPLCVGSVGVSTDEPWPDWMVGRRVYVFSNSAWTIDTVGEVTRRTE